MGQVPSRFLSGVNTFPAKHAMATFPVVPTQWQVTKGDDFIPFRQSTDYTATAAGTGATAAAFAWNGGALKITAGSTSTFKSFEALGANSLQFVPGNNLWHDVRLAVPVIGTNPATDSAVYTGFFDNVDPTAAANGVYFYKPAGGTAVHFIILKAGTTTTFQNVGDLQYPSGLYADPIGSNGALTFNATGTAFSTVTVTTPGFGYRTAPLIVPTGTAGSGAQVYCQLGGSAGYPTADSQGNGSSLYNAIITAPGSGYTAGTLGAEVYPWINFQFAYNGKGRLIAAINGKIVLGFDRTGGTNVTAGSTYNNATVGVGPFYNASGTTLAAGLMSAPPPAGDIYNILPMVPLQLAFGMVGSTGTNRVMYAEEINLGTELN